MIIIFILKGSKSSRLLVLVINISLENSGLSGLLGVGDRLAVHMGGKDIA